VQPDKLEWDPLFGLGNFGVSSAVLSPLVALASMLLCCVYLLFN